MTPLVGPHRQPEAALRVWSDQENDLLVASYLAMLRLDMSGAPYSKAEHRRALAPLLQDRSKAAIELKHMNVSATLDAMGEPWIPGYVPAKHAQASLADALLRAGIPSFRPSALCAIVMAPAPDGPSRRMTGRSLIARRFDPAARDARNRALGRAGEEAVMRYEKAGLTRAGRRDLADRVRWVSEDDGDGAGYDIASFTATGDPRLIEVKTTNGGPLTPFHISRNEVHASEALADRWRVVRVWDFSRSPQAFEIAPPIRGSLDLVTQSYLASLTPRAARPG